MEALLAFPEVDQAGYSGLL